MLRLLSMRLKSGISTVDWPREGVGAEGPPVGPPVLDGDKCTSCGACATACPADCIAVPGEEGHDPPVLDTGPCVACGLCVDACPEDAISMGGPAPLAVHSREDLVVDGSPPREREVRRAPSRLFRQTVDVDQRREVSPIHLLEDRASSLGLSVKEGEGEDPGP